MAPSKKIMLFVCLLVAAMAVGVPVAQGQLPIPLPLPLPIPLPIPSVGILINGTLTCSANLTGNGPPLANATVQLRCGAGNGTLIASAQTNSLGSFAISVNTPSIITTLPLPLPQILSGQCRLVVTTPLVGCNITVPPTGILTSPLTLTGTIISLFRLIFVFSPTGFMISLQ